MSNSHTRRIEVARNRLSARHDGPSTHMTEPHPRPSRFALWSIAGFALVAAIVAALVAPDEWAAGERRRDVTVNGETTSVDVQVGSTEPIVVSPAGDGVACHFLAASRPQRLSGWKSMFR
jgi:ferric-dicitrate binding protein FerR (iron transport regulator)